MADSLHVEIVSPSGSVFQGDARGVVAPGTEGSFEVLRNHAPMIASFEVGSIDLTLQSGDRIRFATSGGFLEVLNNTVTILAETAELASDIDVERARESEQKALARLAEAGDAEERQAAEDRLNRARNRLRAAMGSVGRR